VTENKDKQAPLSPNELDIARLAAQHGHQDGYLLDLIQLADRDLRLVVGLLLNGMIVVGSLSRSEEMAEAVDALRAYLADRFGRDHKPEDQTAEEWENTLSEFSSRASEFVRRIRVEEEELDTRLAESAGGEKVDLEGLPAHLGRKLIDLEARTFLTLKNVQIAAPAQAGVMKIPLLRVAVRQINAWWPIPLDEEGKASFNLFSTESSAEAS
jgi:hypothetical protein